jgi:thymidylate synthase (FAD)
MIKATYVDHMGSDLSVVNAARVSFGKKSAWNWSKELESGTGNGNTLKAGDTKLINYLAKHGHISPFGHCFASFHVKAPIFVARQLVKHKFLRWNEISRRYVTDNIEFFYPDTYRQAADDKKQGSGGTVSDVVGNLAIGKVTAANAKSLITYQQLLQEDVCEEQARMVLPQSTMTEWYWSGSLDAFADMCNLRCKPDTQAETREVANQIDRKMIELFPVSWDALTENGDE